METNISPYNNLIRPNELPYLKRFFFLGLLFSILIGCLFYSVLIGFSILVLFFSLGSLWWKNEIPIFPFCIFFQWFFIISGYVYLTTTGEYPGFLISQHLGNIDAAVFLSLVGLIFIVIGISLSSKLFIFLGKDYCLNKFRNLNFSSTNYNIKILFFFVIVSNFTDWIIDTSFKEINYNAAHVLTRLNDIGAVFFLLLLLASIKQGKGYMLVFIAFLFMLIPSLKSQMSSFSGVFFLLILAILSQWRPWSKSIAEKRKTLKLTLSLVFISAIVISLLFIWQSAVKYSWRKDLHSENITGSTSEKAYELANRFASSIKYMEYDSAAIESVISRTSSGIGYFSIVLTRVPDLLPYENGFFITNSIKHTVTPRILFPEKPVFYSDSWMIRKYAGVHVSGDESGTSIGLGYIPQFYIDYGVAGIILLSLIFGTVLGILYRSLILVSPSYQIYQSIVTVLLLNHFLNYDSEFAKLLGGLIMNAIVFAIVLYFAGPILHRKLDLKSRPAYY